MSQLEIRPTHTLYFIATYFVGIMAKEQFLKIELEATLFKRELSFTKRMSCQPRIVANRFLL